MHLDRLTALFRHVRFQVLDKPEASLPRLSLIEKEEGICVRFSQAAMPDHEATCDISLDFGSKENPLLLALPNELRSLFKPEDSNYPVVQMIVQESKQARCGSPAVLDRMFEVVLILLLRRTIELGAEVTGLLAGLADEHVKFALVAVHDNPGSDWTIDRLAEHANLSRTAFYQRFNKCMGIAPMQYVRRWRLSIARSQLIQGERISSVAFGLGYRSVEGFSRAYHQHFEQWPGEMQKEVAHTA
jgi:AraC-like DNA-binding protein